MTRVTRAIHLIELGLIGVNEKGFEWAEGMLKQKLTENSQKVYCRCKLSNSRNNGIYQVIFGSTPLINSHALMIQH